MKININSIENALNKKLDKVPLKGAWLRLHEEYGVGTAQGVKLALNANDYEELIDIVELETGINLLTTSVADLKEMHREQAVTVAHDEKIAGKKVKVDRLALKTLSNQPLLINQQRYDLPETGHSDLSLDDLISVEHNCLLIIENYRCFDQLHKIKLALPEAYANPLVLYRGDNYYSEKTLRALLTQVSLPVIAMLDIDLKSVIMAQSFTQSIGLMCMPLTELDALLPRAGNAELYAKQLPAYQHSFSNTADLVVTNILRLLSQHQKVWVQEHDIGANYVLQLQLFDPAARLA